MVISQNSFAYKYTFKLILVNQLVSWKNFETMTYKASNVFTNIKQTLQKCCK